MTEPKYKQGDTVHFVFTPKSLADKPDTIGKVHSAFVGEDGKEYVIVIMRNGHNEMYRMLGASSLWDDPKGESNFQKMMKDPAYAKAMGIRLGIYNEDGTLTPNYSDDPNAYWLRDGKKIYDDDEQ